MKITFICAVFPPEPAPAGIMAQQLAKRLTQDGHTLTMIVPLPNRPEGRIYAGFKRRLLSRTVSEDGYSIVRCSNWLIGARRRSVDRLLENITFGVSSMWAALRQGRPDLIIAETWPLFAISFCWLLARGWKVPYFYYVQDVYPEAAEEAGLLKPEGWFSRMLRSWDRLLCRQSARVITISESMRDLLARNRKLPSDCFSVLPNWVDESIFPKWTARATWRRSQGIEETSFVAMFAGTLGHVSGADVLIEVAGLLSAEPDVTLVVIGEGVRKQSMSEEIARRGLKNIRLLPFQPAEAVPEVQASCDASLLTMHENASNTSVPSKLITYLAASRAVVCAARSDSAVSRTVLDARAGLVVPPGNARAIADAILKLKSDRPAAVSLGQNGRQYFEQHFTLTCAYESFRRILHDTQTVPVTAVAANPEFLNQ